MVKDTFFISIEEFYLVLKENKKNIVKKFVDSEFVKTCHEYVNRLIYDKSTRVGAFYFSPLFHLFRNCTIVALNFSYSAQCG